MTLNIKIADKMCSKGKIKFCVKELKLEKYCLISFFYFVIALPGDKKNLIFSLHKMLI